ncbi:unnamed protein product [Rhizophagus irregularis]|nr:unnamed protein product [Rhizophagus irregularis]CAB4416224.1 unnamed protein product [Rhizophagus irregularis]
MKIIKPSPINYTEGNKTNDGIPSNEANDYSNDDEEALLPEDSNFGLCLRKKISDIYSEKIFKNICIVKNKKKLMAIKKLYCNMASQG